MKAVPPLSLSTEKICFPIIKASEFGVKDMVTDLDSGAGAANDLEEGLSRSGWRHDEGERRHP